MSRYNTHRDTNLPDIILALKSRIDKLERSTTTSTTSTVRGIKATDYGTPVAVTSGTFVDTYIFPCTFLAPTPLVRLTATCSDGTTAGEFRLTDIAGNSLTDKNGQPVAPTPIPLGTTVETAFENNQSPNYSNSLPIGADQTLKLQVRRTAGAGTINISTKYLVQIPS